MYITGITLLSIEEYEQWKQYIPPIHVWWWLRSPGDDHFSSCVVNDDGHTFKCANVDVYDGFVRPALKINNLESYSIKPGEEIVVADTEWTVISSELAIKNDTIGMSCFREDSDAPDANDYERSDVKKYIDNWASVIGIVFNR